MSSVLFWLVSHAASSLEVEGSPTRASIHVLAQSPGLEASLVCHAPEATRNRFVGATVRQKDRREAAQPSYRERSTPFRGTGLLRHALPLWLPGKVRVGRRTVVLLGGSTATPSLQLSHR